jgi:hypothetical protein
MYWSYWYLWSLANIFEFLLSSVAAVRFRPVFAPISMNAKRDHRFGSAKFSNVGLDAL